MKNACRELFEKVIEQSGTDAKLIWDDALGTTGAFRMLSNEILLSQQHISYEANAFMNKHNFLITDETYAHVVLAHELGHASDKALVSRHRNYLGIEKKMMKFWLSGNEIQMKRYYKRQARLQMLTEKKAWILAEPFYPKCIDPSIVSAIEDDSLASYKNLIRFVYRLLLLSVRLMPSLKKAGHFFPRNHRFIFEFSKKTVSASTMKPNVFISLSRNITNLFDNAIFMSNQ